MKNSRIAHAMQFVGDDLIAEACTHTSPRHSRLLLAAACAALVLLGGVGCAVYRAYWGAGSAAGIPPADLTRPFETGSEAVASGEEPPPPPPKTGRRRRSPHPGPRPHFRTECVSDRR